MNVVRIRVGPVTGRRCLSSSWSEMVGVLGRSAPSTEGIHPGLLVKHLGVLGSSAPPRGIYMEVEASTGCERTPRGSTSTGAGGGHSATAAGNAMIDRCRTPSPSCSSLLELERLEVDLFRGRQPDTSRQRVFGGQVAAQALAAASHTVPPEVCPRTRCTPTSCAPATPRSRSCTTSSGSATGGRSRPGGWSPASTAPRSSS